MYYTLYMHGIIERAGNVLHSGAIAQWGVIALAALLPVFLIPAPFVTLFQAKMLLVASGILLILVAWGYAAWRAGVAYIPRHPLFLAAATLPVVYFISAAAGGLSSAEFVGSGIEQDTVAALFIWYGLLALAAITLTKDAYVSFLYAFLAAATALALFMFARFALSGAEFFSLNGVLGTLSANPAGNWHDLGIVMGVLCFLSFVLQDAWFESRAWRIVSRGVSFVAFALLFVVNARDVWFATAALFACYAAIRWLDIRRSWDTRNAYIRALVPSVAALVGIILGVAMPLIAERISSFLAVGELEVRPSWQGTWAVGQRILSGERELLFGTGPNTFSREWALHKPSEVNQTLFWNMDFNSGIGLVPTALVTTGALGVAAWALVALALLYTAWRFLLGHRPPAVHAVSGALLLVGLYLVAFHIFYVPTVAISGLTFLFLGAIVAARRNDTGAVFQVDTASAWGVARLAAVLLFALLIVLASLLTLRSLVSNIYTNRAAVIFNKTRSFSDAEKNLTMALRVWGSNDRAHRAAVELGLLSLADAIARGTGDDAERAQLQAQLAATVEHGLTAVAIDDANYENWFTLAQFYQELAGVGVEGAAQAARDAFERARAENPTNPLPVFRLAQLTYAAGDKAATLALLNETLALKSDFGPALFLRSQIEATQGNYEEATNYALRAAQSTPQDPLAWYNLGAILYVRQSFSDAVAALERATALQSDYSNAMFILALSYVQLGRRDDAVALLERVLELNPSVPGLSDMIENIRRGDEPFGDR